MQPDLLPPVSGPLVVEPALGAWVTPALEALYLPLPPECRATAVRRFLEGVAAGSLSAEGLLVARSGDSIAGVILAVPHLHETAFVFPPVIAGLPAANIGMALVRSLADHLRNRGYRWAQCVRDSTDARLGRWLEDGGFTLQGELHRLGCSVGQPEGEHHECPLRWQPYSPDDETRFASLVERSLAGSMDCPRITGFRSGLEILEAHAAAGDCGTSLWRSYHQFQKDSPEDVGVLLMTEDASERTLEVLYMGLVPEVRGRGWGTLLVKEALRLAGERKLPEVRLHVFDGNAPARATYARCGFRKLASSALHLWTSSGVEPGSD